MKSGTFEGVFGLSLLELGSRTFSDYLKIIKMIVASQPLKVSGALT